ncbi:HAMP domain-containing sensor histidine kinase [Clostridiaceae bacterium HSG29]|nr:HAMP domain-containing sensor histidine kinase [Clostridiaceae bacterium HSG29]
MDIKLKKINHKILLSYLIVLLITFVIVFVSFSQIMKVYIEKEIREDLNLTATKILNDIKLSGIEDFNSTRVNKIRLVKEIRLIGKYFDSNIVLLNNRRRIIYKDDELIEKISDLINIYEDKNIIFIRREIMSDGKEIGSFVVYSYLNDIKIVKKAINKNLMVSFLFSSLIAIVFSNLFKKKISKPLIDLRDNIKKYDFNNKNEKIEIKSNDEIGDLAESFNEMINKLYAYSNKNKKFFQNASHELKSPLMSIQGYAEAIKEGIVKEDEVEKSLDIIIDESKNLKELVNSMIMLTKFDDSKEEFEFEERLIFSVIEDVLNRYKLLISEKNIKIETKIDKEIFLKYDYKKLYTAISNIISNSLRYTKNLISVEIYKTESNVIIEITDNGDGIDKEIIDHIFDRFVKGKNGKSGIGLSLTKTIVEAHNGSLNVENTENMGAKFTIKLPI